MWTTGKEREEAKKQAIEQISAKFKEAGVEITGNLITDVVQRITVLGPHEGKHELMSEQAKAAVERILDDNPGLKDFAVDICETLENLAPNPEAKQVLQAAFLPVKASSVKAKDELTVTKMLDVVQSTMDNIAEHPSIRSTMGDAHADKIGNMIKKMNENLKGVDNLGDRAEIMLKGIKEVDKYVEKAGEQAGKSEFSKLSNVIKAGLKVVCTLGMNKSAKLELASAKFAMDNDNAHKLKEAAKVTSSGLKSAVNITSQAKEKSSGMGR